MATYYAINLKGGDWSILGYGQLVRFSSGQFQGREARVVKRKRPNAKIATPDDVYIVQLGRDKINEQRVLSHIVTVRKHLVPVVRESPVDGEREFS